jgi:hypothetical protein
METVGTKQKFIELRAQGYSYDKIATKLKKSKQALIDWNNEYKEEIANRKALELEALQEQFFLLKEHRLRAFGETLQKIKKEIDKRTLKDVSTDKLLDLYTKYYLLLKEEIVEPVFKTTGELQADKEDRELLESLTAPEKLTKLKVV